MTLIDTNVLLDLATDDPVWADWSVRQLDAAAVKGPLVINDVVYAELSVGFERIEELDDLLDEAGVTLEEIPREALFLAGKAFRRYRAAGGTRMGVLPDFFYRRPCRRSWSAAADTRCQTLPYLFPVCHYGDAGSAVRLFGKATRACYGLMAVPIYLG
jgi:predicted nucleic acid-binding protein